MVFPESPGQRARDLEKEVIALWLARKDPGIPWHAKAVLVLTIAYAMSPVDLIPDFIPVIGYIDDLIIVPAGIAFAVSRIPPGVIDEYRERAGTADADTAAFRRAGFIIVLLIWLVVFLFFVKVALLLA
jgi:uncharacterized membrane protein YkvA (DUF1232 family)